VVDQRDELGDDGLVVRDKDVHEAAG
jgi:hypothetical protein